MAASGPRVGLRWCDSDVECLLEIWADDSKNVLVRDVPDAEIFSFSSIVSIVASRTSTLALITDHGSKSY